MTNHVRGTVAVALVTACGLLSAFCTTADENPAAARHDSGTDGASSGSSGASSGGDGAVGVLDCNRFGGTAGVATFADAVLARVKTDCRLKGAFDQVPADGQQHLKECFELQIQFFYQCPGVVYPTDDSNGDPCRTLDDVHSGYNLHKDDFTAFVDDVTVELRAKGLTDDEIRSGLSPFVGSRPLIVQDEGPYNAFCVCADGLYNGQVCLDPNAGDSGTDAPDDAPADAPTDG